jgi:hypothetical protein
MNMNLFFLIPFGAAMILYIWGVCKQAAGEQGPHIKINTHAHKSTERAGIAAHTGRKKGPSASATRCD